MFEKICSLALASSERDVIGLSAYLMQNVDLPTKGCEYAWVASAALMAAVRNEGTRPVPDEKVREVLLRTRRQAVTSLCGVTACGIAAAVTTCFRVLLGTACPNSQAVINTQIGTRVADALAAQGGDPCCKLFLWTALAETPALAEEYLKISIPADRSLVNCPDADRPPQCRQDKCPFSSS